MNFSALAAALDASGVPWAMDGWSADELRGLPFVVLCSDEIERLHRDNRSTAKVERWRIELYTEQRGFEQEAALADALDSAGFSFSEADAGPVDQSDALGAHLHYFYCSTLN